MAAFAKLQGLVTEKAVVLPGRNAINVVLGLAAITLGARVAVAPGEVDPFWMLLAVSLVLGVLMALPVGGADMPVVIALLNSYSGLAAAATGFALSNSVLVIAGALVGASGLILTQLMCRAMNRSMLNVLSGGWSTTEVSAESSQDFYAGRVKSTSPEEVAILLDGVRRLTVVPGYGLAVAQAQYAVRDLAQALSDRGVTVDFAIHPVAGRMPGHMNVLLTEANISYERLKELEPANSTLTETDLALVIGANDVVNPAARDPSSPIAGMPVLEVDKARTVVVVKRSLAAGFAGIPNPLFVAPNTLMLFADAKEGVLGILKALKEP
jgi:NAD(P) transhydrogenase subunit beta